MSAKKGNKEHKKGRMARAICRLFGTLIILAVIAAVLPVTAPRLFGYEIFHVVSGSMEPEIPVGSAAYVKAAEPSGLQEGDVIAFRQSGSVVMHRVTENLQLDGALTTMGDANEIEDPVRVPYDDVIGKVEYHFPLLGQVMAAMTGVLGKVLLLCLVLCGILLHVLAGQIG